MSDSPELPEKIRQISETLRGWQYEYYVLSRPSVSDAEYDQLFDLLTQLEEENPGLRLPDSPTQRVGSDLTHDLPESAHTIPVLSLDKAYSVEELTSWASRTAARADVPHFSMVVEEKIDGISIVLYYEEGLLVRAVTRGNGEIGNDVTANVKTIGSVPLRLPEPVTVAVRGEIYLPIGRFEELNSRLETPYANPRNLAAGTIRRIRSSETAAVPLEIFVYEGFFNDSQMQFASHREVLEKLQELGFRMNDRTAWFASEKEEGFQPLEELEDWVVRMTAERPGLPYEIDGLVIKVNELPLREKLERERERARERERERARERERESERTRARERERERERSRTRESGHILNPHASHSLQTLRMISPHAGPRATPSGLSVPAHPRRPKSPPATPSSCFVASPLRPSSSLTHSDSSLTLPRTPAPSMRFRALPNFGCSLTPSVIRSDMSLVFVSLCLA